MSSLEAGDAVAAAAPGISLPKTRCCAGCGVDKTYDCFSKGQLKRKAKARCASCIVDGPMMSADYTAELKHGSDAVIDASIDALKGISLGAPLAPMRLAGPEVGAQHNTPDFKKRLEAFCLAKLSFLSGFAAAKFSKHGKGALFVFANVDMEQLIGGDEFKHLDRQMCLLWGALDKPRDDTAFALEELRGNMHDSTTTLRASAETNCSQKCFPVVIAASPSHNLYPDILKGQLRAGAKGRPEMASSIVFRFLDFSAALKFGRANFESAPCLALNLDRNETMPTK